MTLLEVDQLYVAFGDQEPVVRGVTFTVERGQTVALVGESGSGKSVTALSILRLLPYPYAYHPEGKIVFDGAELLPEQAVALETVRGNRIAMVFQEPMTSLNPLHTIGRQIGEVLLVHKKMSPNAARARTLELLRLVALPDPEKRLTAYPHELSGGQRQRVMIAMALANDPDLLIADEPTTALDVTVQAQILALLKEVQKKMGMALLLITHDLGIVRKMADKVCVMQRGDIVEQGPAERVFAQPRHPYTRELLNAEPKGKPLPVSKKAPCVFRGRDIKVHFPVKKGLLRRTVDHIRAVDGVSFSIREGETVGIVGESGSGKTTLGKALLRLIPCQGAMTFEKTDVAKANPAALRALRKSMQIVFQDPFGSLSPRMTVGQIVAEGLGIHAPEMPEKERRERVDNALKEVGLDPLLRERYPHEFSGGQRQRIAIARAMILQPKFVVLDEPTSALDRSVQAQIVDLLRQLQQRHGLAYLFISHDLRIVRALAHHVIVMQAGKVVEQGPAERLFKSPQKKYTKTLLAAALPEKP